MKDFEKSLESLRNQNIIIDLEVEKFLSENENDENEKEEEKNENKNKNNNNKRKNEQEVESMLEKSKKNSKKRRLNLVSDEKILNEISNKEDKESSVSLEIIPKIPRPREIIFKIYKPEKKIGSGKKELDEMSEDGDNEEKDILENTQTMEEYADKIREHSHANFKNIINELELLNKDFEKEEISKINENSEVNDSEKLERFKQMENELNEEIYLEKRLEYLNNILESEKEKIMIEQSEQVQKLLSNDFRKSLIYYENQNDVNKTLLEELQKLNEKSPISEVTEDETLNIENIEVNENKDLTLKSTFGKDFTKDKKEVPKAKPRDMFIKLLKESTSQDEKEQDNNNIYSSKEELDSKVNLKIYHHYAVWREMNNIGLFSEEKEEEETFRTSLIETLDYLQHQISNFYVELLNNEDVEKDKEREMALIESAIIVDKKESEDFKYFISENSEIANLESILQDYLYRIYNEVKQAIKMKHFYEVFRNYHNNSLLKYYGEGNYNENIDRIFESSDFKNRRGKLLFVIGKILQTQVKMVNSSTLLTKEEELFFNNTKSKVYTIFLTYVTNINNQTDLEMANSMIKSCYESYYETNKRRVGELRAYWYAYFLKVIHEGLKKDVNEMWGLQGKITKFILELITWDRLFKMKSYTF